MACRLLGLGAGLCVQRAARWLAAGRGAGVKATGRGPGHAGSFPLKMKVTVRSVTSLSSDLKLHSEIKTSNMNSKNLATRGLIGLATRGLISNGATRGLMFLVDNSDLHVFLLCQASGFRIDRMVVIEFDETDLIEEFKAAP